MPRSSQRTGDRSTPVQPSVHVPAGQPFEATTAQRYDLIVKPQRPGVYPARIEYRDWITGVLRATARTSITVT